MKKFMMVVAFVAAMCATSNAQTVVRNGNVFTFASSRTSTKDTLVTKFKFEDSKGNSFPIVINKRSGRCYIWKTSSKTGKLHKQYMKEDISIAVSKELGIKYTPKTTKASK